jgi:integrase/recombinase XerD
MTTSSETTFNQNYQKRLQHLKLKGLQPKTIDAYSRGIRRIGKHFGHQVNDLTEQQLLDYFHGLLDTHSWSAVKLDLYSLKFFYEHVLGKPWEHVNLIKIPKAKRLPDIVSVDEAARLFMATNILSYRVFFFTVYSLGLRVSEGLRLGVGDIDAHHMRVHIRNAKGNKDRFVPLPLSTLDTLRRFWSVHRHPALLFPNRKGGLQSSQPATTHLDQAGVSAALKMVLVSCGIKKKLPCTAFATATQHI